MGARDLTKHHPTSEDELEENLSVGRVFYVRREHHARRNDCYLIVAIEDDTVQTLLLDSAPNVPWFWYDVLKEHVIHLRGWRFF